MLEANCLVNFAVSYSEGVYGKDCEIVSADGILEAVYDVGDPAAKMTKLAL